MKYLHIYKDNSFCESDSFKPYIGKDGYIAISDEEYAEIGNTKRVVNGIIIDIPQSEIQQKIDEDNARKIEEEKQNRISELKGLLASTDYKAIKYAEGELTAEEYEETKLQRRAWREEINILDGTYDVNTTVNNNENYITIPNTVENINAELFSNIPQILAYDFSNYTFVPVLSNADTFSNINALAKIIVPDALYDEWIAATNWSSYANYIYKASEVTE